MEFPDIRPCPELCGRREEIRSLSVGLHMGSEGTQSHIRHKMLKRESLRIHRGRVFHLVGVESHSSLHLTATLCSREVSPILISVDFEIAIDADSLWNPYFLLDGRVKSRCYEVKVGGISLQVHVRLEIFGVIEVGHISIAAHLQCSRQRDMEIAQFHPLHVPRRLPFDSERLVGPFAHELLWHVPHHPHEVLFSEIAIYIRPQFSRMIIIESVEVQVSRSLELRVRSF